MDHFNYRDGRLYAEDVALDDIIDAVGTPFYCYSSATLERHYRVFAEAVAGLDAHIYYAVKANSNLGVIATLARLGAGADVVSIGEMKKAMAAGVPADRIVFSGVGKSEAELAEAIDLGVHQINVESEPELEVLGRIVAAKGVTVPIAIRVNPDVDARTHAKISTGKAENKFGIELARVPAVFSRARDLVGINARAVAVHIGSQLTDLEPYRQAYGRVADLVRALRADGHDISVVDLGGGLGIDYQGEVPPSPADYGAMVSETVGVLGCAVAFEPGRMIAGNAGILVSRVIYVKQGLSRSFAIIDAAMNDLIRPTLYDAYHEIVTVREAVSATRETYDIVGPICETGDTFATGRALPALDAGDALAFRTAGAYGAVMASTYNARPLVPEVLVCGDRFDVVARRFTVEDQMARESIPDWLGGGDVAEAVVAHATIARKASA